MTFTPIKRHLIPSLINVTDESDNPLTNHQVTFKNEKGSAEFVEPPQQSTDAYGVATINMVSQVAEENTISATLPNGFLTTDNCEIR
ncbi:Ig-like domain-containing protein [Escherichia coli]|nr:Ig-like domain-containing protein [Escherichia coli]